MILGGGGAAAVSRAATARRSGGKGGDGPLATVRLPKGATVGSLFSASVEGYGGMMVTVPPGSAPGGRLGLYGVSASGSQALEWLPL